MVILGGKFAMRWRHTPSLYVVGPGRGCGSSWLLHDEVTDWPCRHVRHALYPRRPIIGLQLRRKPDSNPELKLLRAIMPPGAEPEWPI